MKQVSKVKLVVVLMAALTMSSCKSKNSNSNQNESKIMKEKKETYVLVHAAWLGGWQWGHAMTCKGTKRRAVRLLHSIVGNYCIKEKFHVRWIFTTGLQKQTIV